MSDRVLVAGIGNVFLGDDGFGVEVVRRLDTATLPGNVDVADYGIRGVHLAYELLDGNYGALVLVDAVPMNEPPGTVVLLEVTADTKTESLTVEDVVDGAAVDAHSMNPHVVLRALSGLGGAVPRVVVVGCEPQTLTGGMALSPPVAAAVELALPLVVDTARAEAARLELTGAGDRRA